MRVDPQTGASGGRTAMDVAQEAGELRGEDRTATARSRS